MICRHCRRRKANCARGLCWRDYHTPSVRAMYPSRNKHGNDGDGVVVAGYDPPPEPTQTLPGTVERMEELARRAAAGVSLWHRGDARRGLE